MPSGQRHFMYNGQRISERAFIEERRPVRFGSHLSGLREALSPRIARNSDGFLVLRPAYGPGMHLNARLYWTTNDLANLGDLLRAKASQDLAADVLGRPPKSLVDALRRHGIGPRPEGWLYYKRDMNVANRAAPLLHYPYVAKVREDDMNQALVLEVNHLVARYMPEHMRADICQEILTSLVAGEMTPEQVRARGIKAFISKWKKEQGTQWGEFSIDAPRDDGRSWHEMLSAEQFDGEWQP